MKYACIGTLTPGKKTQISKDASDLETIVREATNFVQKIHIYSIELFLIFIVRYLDKSKTLLLLTMELMTRIHFEYVWDISNCEIISTKSVRK